MTDIAEITTAFPVGTNTPLDQTVIFDLLKAAGGWEQKYRQLLLVAKSMPNLPENLKIPENAVSGCESKIWLICYHDDKGKFHFAVDSESRIVKALVITILAAVNHESADMICDFQVAYYLDHLGFRQHITPSRANGLLAVWKKMSDFCSDYA